ncbi:MAG: hypothetical protein IT384_10425 [Deltaproteobacteria bacterium]|nr:hypothetical protein [Deltaproteobacteria bacterium]
MSAEVRRRFLVRAHETLIPRTELCAGPREAEDLIDRWLGEGRSVELLTVDGDGELRLLARVVSAGERRALGRVG